MTGDATANDQWPSLPLDAWRDTQATLHLWTQIVGKVRLARAPWINHSWTATLYVTPKGLTTASIPYGARTFQIDLDFIHHLLVIQASDGRTGHFKLEPQSVAQFYARLMGEMRKIDLDVEIHRKPERDSRPYPVRPRRGALRLRSRVRQSLLADSRPGRSCVQRVSVAVHRQEQPRALLLGLGGSRRHALFGASRAAASRRRSRIARQDHARGLLARSGELRASGPGGGAVPYAAFYAYAYPEPAGYADAAIEPDAAFYSADLREFILPYDAVRQSADPDATLTAFLQSTYEAAADLAQWDRAVARAQRGFPAPWLSAIEVDRVSASEATRLFECAIEKPPRRAVLLAPGLPGRFGRAGDAEDQDTPSALSVFGPELARHGQSGGCLEPPNRVHRRLAPLAVDRPRVVAAGIERLLRATDRVVVVCARIGARRRRRGCRRSLARRFMAHVRSTHAAGYRSNRTRDRRAGDRAAHGTRCRSDRTIRLVPGRTTAEHRDDRDRCRCLRCISRVSCDSPSVIR
jgi:hypothetical protein